eukprot:2544579-Rhodomonas_salina.1
MAAVLTRAVGGGKVEDDAIKFPSCTSGMHADAECDVLFGTFCSDLGCRLAVLCGAWRWRSVWCYVEVCTGVAYVACCAMSGTNIAFSWYRGRDLRTGASEARPRSPISLCTCYAMSGTDLGLRHYYRERREHTRRSHVGPRETAGAKSKTIVLIPGTLGTELLAEVAAYAHGVCNAWQWWYRIVYQPTRLLRDVRYRVGVWCCQSYAMRGCGHEPGISLYPGTNPLPANTLTICDAGTGLAYGAVSAYALAARCPVLTFHMIRSMGLAIGLRACYAMSGTDLVYGATSATVWFMPPRTHYRT